MLARPCLETTPTLGKRAKNPQPIRFGFLVNGGGVVPRIKRLLKVRNRSAAGCCEPVRTGAKSLPVRPLSLRSVSLASDIVTSLLYQNGRALLTPLI